MQEIGEKDSKMKNDHIRASRINTLYSKALSGKYNWNDLLEHARSMGVTDVTAKSYLAAVKAQLRKSGRIA
jgi:hypothetical protein